MPTSILSIARRRDHHIAQTNLVPRPHNAAIAALIAAADRALGWARGARAHLGLVERAGGVILVAMGVLLVTGQLTLINIWAIRTFGLGLAL